MSSPLLSGGTAVILAGLLLLLFVYRRRGYVLIWTGAWLLVAASMFLVAPEYARAKAGDLAYGLSQFLMVGAGLVFVLGADAYRTTPTVRRELGLLLTPVFLWFALAPLALGFAAVFAPGHLLAAGAIGAAGGAHLWLLRRAWLLGAAIVGGAMLVLAGLHVWIAVARASPADAQTMRVLFVQLAAWLVMGLGMQLMTFEDMTYELRAANRRLEAAQAELRLMVTTDPLTGCGNRRYFDEIIGRELRRHRRYGVPLSLLFVDIDRFKAINDTLGHEAGDRVLQGVAAFLLRKIREADYIFRWGGDEFLILISCDGKEAARKGAELQAEFAASPDAATLPRGVGLSYGAVEVPSDTTEIMPLVRTADERMYLNKARAGD
jgi:diguanylate cyclase (GGDEF)-like protein